MMQRMSRRNSVRSAPNSRTVAQVFRARLIELAAARRGWGDNKERARELLAAEIPASARQVERWLTEDGIKEPRASVWLRVEELWLAMKGLPARCDEAYDVACEIVEDATRRLNSDKAAPAADHGVKHAVDKGHFPSRRGSDR